MPSARSWFRLVIRRSRRSLTKAPVREVVERCLVALAEDIASGEWIDIPYIGKVQVNREEGRGYVTSFTARGQLVRRAEIATPSFCPTGADAKHENSKPLVD